MKQQMIVKTLCVKIEKQLSSASDIWRYAVLFSVREAVKLPLMWKLWSHEEVNKLRRKHTHAALKHFPAHCTWTRTVRGLTVWASSSGKSSEMFVVFKDAVCWYVNLVTGIYKLALNSSVCTVIVLFWGISCSFDVSFHRVKLKNWQEGCWEKVYMFGKGRGRTSSFLRL